MSTNPAMATLLASYDAALGADGSLVLTAALLPAGPASGFVAGMPGGTLALTGASVVPDDRDAPTRIAVAGHCAGPWVLPGIPGISLADIGVGVAFVADVGGQPSGTLAIGAATMASGQNTVLLAGTQSADGLLHLAVSPANATTPSVGLADLVGVLTGRPELVGIANAATVFAAMPIGAVDLSFGFAPAAATSIALTCRLGQSWSIVDGKAFALDDPAVTLVAVSGPADAKGLRSEEFGAVLAATVALGSSSYAATLDLTDPDFLTFVVRPADGQVLPVLLDIAGAVGGDSLRSTVKSGLDATGLGEIAIDGVRIGFSVETRQVTLATLSGHLTLGGGTVAIMVQLLPTFTFTGGLAGTKGADPKASAISLNALAAQVLGDSAGLPPMSIDQLALFADPHLGTYRLAVTVAEQWAWDVSGNGSGPVLTLEDVGLHLERTPQAVSGGLAVSFSVGGLDIGMAADYRGQGQGWFVAGTGAQADGVALGDFIADLAGKLGAMVPDAVRSGVQSFRIATVAASFDTQSGAFAFAADVQSKGTIPLGLKSYDLDLRVSIESVLDPATRARSIAAHLEADLDIGAATFTLAFDFGPVTSVTGAWRSTDGSSLAFADIAAAIGVDCPVSAPAGLDLGLKSASFSYHSDPQSFTLSGESNAFGDAYFTLQKGQDGSWGFVFGVDRKTPGRLSDLPGVGSQLQPADFLAFEQIGILVASTAVKGFSVPSLPPLPPQPGQAGRSIVGRTVAPLSAEATLQLVQGVSLVAVMDLAKASDDKRLSNLRSILGQSSLIVQASFGVDICSLFIELAGKVSIPAGSGKLALTNPAVRIDALPLPSFQLSGGLQFTVQGTPVTATARLILSETEAQVAVSLAADQGALPAPPGIKGLHLKQFGIEMGVFFEPPGVDLGLQGKFDVGPAAKSRSDEFAFVLEIVGEAPNILYFSFYLDELDLGQVVTLFTDQQDPDSIKGLKIVRASDLSFHWSESQVILPDGTVAMPGFGFSASLEILKFQAHADLEVGIPMGVRGRAEMAPINLKDVLHLQGDGKGIFRTFQQIKGRWTEVQNGAVVRQVPALATQRQEVVAAGGPVIEINSQHSPYVHVNWQVTLFDCIRESVDVTIDDKGFLFVLKFSADSVADFTLNCSLRDQDRFDAAASLVVALDQKVGPLSVAGVSIGSLHVVASCAAALAIRLNPQVFALMLSGTFSFEGLSMSMPQVSVSAAPSSLKGVAQYVFQQVRDNADAIFHDLVSDATRWAGLVGKGVITGVNDMAGVLKGAYNQSAQDAARLMRAANQAVDAVAAGLRNAYGQAGDAAAATMRSVGIAATDAANGLKAAYGMGAQQVAAAMRTAGYAANEVGGALKDAFNETAQQAGQVLKAAGFAADEVGTALKDAFGQTADQAAHILHDVGFAANQVGDALRTVFSVPAQGAANLLRQAGYTADQVGDALKNAYGVGIDGVAQVLRTAGYGVDEIGNALRHDFNASADDLARVLKGAGFAVDQVGNFIKNVFGMGPDALRTVLQGAGYAGDQVKGFFQDLGGAFADTFKDIGKKLDPTSW